MKDGEKSGTCDRHKGDEKYIKCCVKSMVGRDNLDDWVQKRG
jgi:hypothetical protein